MFHATKSEIKNFEQGITTGSGKYGEAFYTSRDAKSMVWFSVFRVPQNLLFYETNLLVVGITNTTQCYGKYKEKVCEYKNKNEDCTVVKIRSEYEPNWFLYKPNHKCDLQVVQCYKFQVQKGYENFPE